MHFASALPSTASFSWDCRVQSRQLLRSCLMSLALPVCERSRGRSRRPEAAQARAVKRLLGHRLDSHDAEAARREWHDLVS